MGLFENRHLRRPPVVNCWGTPWSSMCAAVALTALRTVYFKINSIVIR